MATSGGRPTPTREEGETAGVDLPAAFPAVAVFDGSTRAALYERWLPEAVTVRRVESLSTGPTAVDEAVAVALVRHELPGDKRSVIARLIDEHGPHCRTVVTTTKHSPVADEHLDGDACLSSPVDREALREAVSTQIGMATYGLLLARYYEATARLTSREVELGARDCDGDDRLDELRGVVSDLGARVRTLQKRLSADQARAVLNEIAPPEFERRRAERPAGQAKYRPESCSDCGRDWNVNPDGSRAGYDHLGAFVWECTDCGAVHDRSSAAHRRVARRR